ncbi:sigma-70 family RNA polymerase sigma factor [Hyphococcus sp. DH-69]|uniref:sigma-70 family RNA polymerase sigma factor n=1 Tax=Hyphococcus formosus TaxID=3143534 RepID=UPI00398B8525
MSTTFTADELNDVLPALNRFALSLTRNEDAAHDLVQDSVERALMKSEYYEPGTNFRSWMFTLCKRLFLNQVRKQKSRGVNVEISDAPQQKIAADAPQDVILECSEMLDCFDKLPKRDRVVLSLIVIEGMKYEEAAKRLRVPVGTVRSRLSRARSRLKEMTAEWAAYRKEPLGDANSAAQIA